MTTTTQELLKKLRAFSIPLTGVPNFVEAEYLMKESADALAALQAAVARLREKKSSLDRLLAIFKEVQAVTAERDAAFARLAEIEAQNLMARQIILEHGEGVVGAAAAGASPQPAQVPAGYVLVPVEPTDEMIDAGQDVEDLYRRGTPETWGKVYRAMLAASPVEPSQGLELSADDVRADGGIVHSDGNIFFTNIGKLNAAINAKGVK